MPAVETAERSYQDNHRATMPRVFIWASQIKASLGTLSSPPFEETSILDTKVATDVCSFGWNWETKSLP